MHAAIQTNATCFHTHLDCHCLHPRGETEKQYMSGRCTTGNLNIPCQSLVLQHTLKTIPLHPALQNLYSPNVRIAAFPFLISLLIEYFQALLQLDGAFPAILKAR